MSSRADYSAAKAAKNCHRVTERIATESQRHREAFDASGLRSRPRGCGKTSHSNEQPEPPSSFEWDVSPQNTAASRRRVEHALRDSVAL